VRTAFAYDAAGQRVAVQNSAGTVQTVYDGERAILEGVAGFGQGQAYLWGEATVAAGRTLGDQATALAVGYLGDRLGNVTAVTDAAGAPRGACVYDGFGRLQASTRGATGTLRFQGLLGVRAETAPSDLYWMGYRTFDATTGRFLTTDPLPGELVQPQSLHRYAYALNNPLRYVDPLGLRPEDQLLAFGPAVGGIQNTDSPFREPPDFQPLSDMSELRDILENLLRELQAEGLDVARSSGGGQSQPSFILTISEKYGWAQGQRNVRDANKAASTNKTQPDQAQQLIDILNNMLPQGS
jgi:RHS repeat-associated protein